MYISSSLLLAAVFGIAQAQTPSGFTPRVNNKLDVLFNSTAVNSPGQTLTKDVTATQPKIALPNTMVNMSDTFIFVMLDLDVPAAQGNSTRRVLLHAMNTGFKATQQQINGTAKLLASSAKGPAEYIAPSPPATDTMPHRYVQLLFRQPASLDVQSLSFAGNQDRINFDVTAFIAEHKLKDPIAANFFRVDGRTTGTRSGTATGTGGIARNTLQPFTGVAGKTDFSRGLVGLLCGLVLFGI